MAQHDYVIDNSTGANVRADINSALLAISSNNSGSSAPSTTYGLQSFANTTDSMLQLRNAANNAFVNLRKFDGSLPLPDGSESSPSLFFDDDTNTGLFSSAADTLNITTGGSTAVTVDSSQRVGIGTNPTQTLDVTASNTVGIAEFTNTATSLSNNNYTVKIDSSAHTSNMTSAGAFAVDVNAGRAMTINGNGKVGLGVQSPISDAVLTVGTADSGCAIFFSRLQSGKHDCAIENNGGKLIFKGGSAQSTVAALTPLMTLDGSARLLIGTSDASGKIHARTNVGSSSNFADNNAAIPAGDQYIHISNSNTGGNEQAGFVMNASGSASAIGAIYVHKTNSYLGSMVFRMRTNATTSASRMEIDSQGNIGAPNGTNIHNASDARVKKNVTDLDKGLSAIKSLRPVSFNWIDGFCDKEKNTLYGFIAQEVETVDNNLIEEFGNGSVTVEGETINDTLRVNEKFIIPMLVKAIQELSTKVEALEAA